MALSVEQYVPDTPVAYANIHSFNRWFDETWDFDGDRISPTALLSFRDLDATVAELDHVLERGARVVLFPTGPAGGRSPGDPYFDPIWARLDEAGVLVAFHIMEHWYNEHIAPAWGQEPTPAPWHMSAWQWQNTYGQRPIEDTLSALIFDNLFGRFPNLMVLSSEFGAAWVPHFVEHMDKSRGMGRNGPWIGGPLRERPSEIFRRHVRVAPYPEDDVVKIVTDLGHADSIVMGSDYPHAEGLADAGGLRQAARSAPGVRPAQDHARQRRGVARRRVTEPSAEEFRARVRAFLAAHRDAARSVDGWRRTLYEHGFLGVSWPTEYGGGGLTRAEQVVLAEEFARAGVPTGAPQDNFGIKMVGNTLLRWGTEEQRRYFLPRILAGDDRWCQGYSEPNAGSDLAALSTRADARRRRMGDRRAEDLDVARRGRVVDLPPGAHRPDRGRPSRDHVPPVPDGPTRDRGAPDRDAQPRA